MPLVNVTKKIEKAREKLGLDEGEQVLAGCTTNPSGTIKGMMAREMGGAIAAAIAGRSDAGDVTSFEGSMASAFPSGQRFLVLTDRRLFTTGVSTWTGSPKSIDATWNRSDVVALTVDKGRMASPLQIVFADGSGVEVEGAAGTNPMGVAEAFGPASPVT